MRAGDQQVTPLIVVYFMITTPYKIHQIIRRLSTGATKPYVCSVKAVLKADCDEAPLAVYNELVAVRLAQTLHIPIASGLITDRAGSDAFASMYVGRSDEQLPALRDYQLKAVAFRYPDEIAALVAFDIFIGNTDRRGNIVASLVSSNKIFGGIDHGIALLGNNTNTSDSLKKLRSDDLIVQFHPFYRYVEAIRLTEWTLRIASANARDIEECCLCSKNIGGVSVSLQQNLADALKIRQTKLSNLVAFHLKKPIAAV